MRLESEQEVAEVAKNFNMLESMLLKNRTLTLFGEINQEVARRTAERLLALAFESDDPNQVFAKPKFAKQLCGAGQ